MEVGKNSMTKIRLALAVFAAAWLARGADTKVPFEKYKLKNGMRVILSLDNSVPVVAVYMIYNVGARSEEKGRTGFARLFEHQQFMSSMSHGSHSRGRDAGGEEVWWAMARRSGRA